MQDRPAFGASTSAHIVANGALARRVGVASAALLGLVFLGCSGEPSDPGGGMAGSTAGGTNPIAGTGNSTGGTSVVPNGGSAPTAGTSNTTGGTFAMTGGTGGASGGTGNTAGGSGGESPSGGMSMGGGSPTGPSAGCMKDPPADEAQGQNVLHMIDISGMAQIYVAGYTHRKYCTTIPKGYDPTKPYPVVFYGPGCGATACEGNNFTGRDDIFIVQAIAGADAKGDNIVPKNGAPGCFQAGREGTPDSPELNYFDGVMAEVEGKYCIDKGKIYAAGTSSGAWLSNYLACKRGGIVRGSAADSGGLNFDHGTCTGGAGVLEMPGDSAVTQDSQKREIGAASVRDMFIQLNGCSTTPTKMSFGKANDCDYYGGCASPVVWCNVGGGHQSGNSYLSGTGWAFWSTLK
ncbi:MAG TPA: hypothetical protein VHB79_05280 [Polyangiaceae bacterium]|nr:hypothetical protein [Polyangiaceae bacterium]